MKPKILALSSGTAILCDSDYEAQSLVDFPPNEPLNLFKVLDFVKAMYDDAIFALQKATRPVSNSKFSQEKIASDFEALEKAINFHLRNQHNGLHEVYNCLNLLRNRLDLETRSKHPVPNCLKLKIYLDTICSKFVQENKGIDLLATMIFEDGKSLRKNPLLKTDHEKRLEEYLAKKQLD
jgi:hypothetical protein